MPEHVGVSNSYSSFGIRLHWSPIFKPYGKDQLHIQVSNIVILVLMVHNSFEYFNSCSS
jgi:hypothetical protein